MKIPFALFVFLSVSVAAQSVDVAKATYAKNGVLIGLTNLAPLQDCRIDGMEGKVSSVEYRADSVIFELKEKKKQAQSFQFDLSKLPNIDRRTLRRGFMKKGIPIKALGY